MEKEEAHGYYSHQTPSKEWCGAKTIQHVRNVGLVDGIDTPGKSVHYALNHNNTTQPAVQQVVGVETNAQ